MAQAQAQEQSPYYIGVSQGFTHDSNVFRTATNETGDTISSTGLLAGVNQRLGRQRLFADASGQVNRYRNATTLNNKSYSLVAGLDWETIETLSGTLRYNTRNSLTYFGAADGSTVTSDQITQQFTASARYGLASQLMLEVGYDHNRLKLRSLPNRDAEQNTVNAGLNWAVGGKLTVGLGVRATKGRQETVPVADETERKDVDLTAVWNTGGASIFNARVSSTREKHTLNTIPELSETTGAISWAYRPTGRLSITALVSRDTGTESTFATPVEGATALPVDSSRISTSWSLDTRYELTGKSSLNAGVRQRTGTLTSTLTERIEGYTFGVSYAPTRSIGLTCSVARESRSVSGANAYESTITGCVGELTLR
jgi:opacity protein-like surface antigen